MCSRILKAKSSIDAQVARVHDAPKNGETFWESATPIVKPDLPKGPRPLNEVGRRKSIIGFLGIVFIAVYMLYDETSIHKDALR